MANDEGTQQHPGNDAGEHQTTAGTETDAALDIETFDADHDGKIGLIDGYRATLGLVDAELELAAEKADHKGVKGHLADAAHKLVDKLDND